MVRLTQLIADEALKMLLEDKGFSYPVFISGDVPTNPELVPLEYVSIFQNGSYENQTLERGIYEVGLVISLNSRLLSTDSINIKKERMMLEEISGIIEPFCRILIGETNNELHYLAIDDSFLLLDEDALTLDLGTAGDMCEYKFSIGRYQPTRARSILGKYSSRLINIDTVIKN